jgi:hypothetical protein
MPLAAQRTTVGRAWPFNLACYYCLLGDDAKARERLRKACKMEKQWKTSALDDPDLKAIRGDTEAIE